MPIRLQIQPKPCAECGYDPAFHAFERWSLFFEHLLRPLFRPLAFLNTALTRMTAPLIDRVALPVARFCCKLKLGTILYDVDDQDNENTQFLWNEAKRRGIVMYQFCPFHLRRRFFIATYKGKSCAFEGLPRLARPVASLDWVDDKVLLKRKFEESGFPVARGGAARGERQALVLFHRLVKPVITKPDIGSGGRHTTLHLMNDDQLLAGFRCARELSPRVVIEEQLIGPVIRATLIHGALVAVLQRDPPQVVGDGIHSVRALVGVLNMHPLRQGSTFAKVPFNDLLIERELSRQSLSWDDIPERGRLVFLHFKVNWGIGGTSRDVTDEVHPENKKLFENIAAYLDDDIVGIDFIIADISRSWKETERCGVIECNSLPHIANHHLPFSGQPRDIAGPIWDMMFPTSK